MFEDLNIIRLVLSLAVGAALLDSHALVFVAPPY